MKKTKQYQVPKVLWLLKSCEVLRVQRSFLCRHISYWISKQNFLSLKKKHQFQSHPWTMICERETQGSIWSSKHLRSARWVISMFVPFPLEMKHYKLCVLERKHVHNCLYVWGQQDHWKMYNNNNNTFNKQGCYEVTVCFVMLQKAFILIEMKISIEWFMKDDMTLNLCWKSSFATTEIIFY